MASAKEIKQRLSSIKNTKKTTHAMELVSASKMRKSVEAAVQAREYRVQAWRIMKRLRGGMLLYPTHPMARFFEDSDDKRTTIIAITSNRGLCGAYNSNVVKQVLHYTSEHKDEELQLIGIGKRGVASLTGLGLNVTQAYEKDDQAKDDSSMRDLAASIYSHFTQGETGRVFIASTHYVSTMVQEAQLQPLFPFPPEEAVEAEEPAIPTVYTNEPTELELLETIIPRIIEVQLYQALLESNASEHSARMLAMKNATEAAGDMANQLNLVYNRARQAAITKEIAEIAAGSAAVR